MRKVISVFFQGTSQGLYASSTLAYFLDSRLNSRITGISDPTQKSIIFSGVGLTHGNSGVIFGSGIDSDCQTIIDEIDAEFKQGNFVTLNVYGHSRGGNSALMLAKQLSAIDPTFLEINLVMLDPVPGNSIISSTLDIFDITLANKTMDLRQCTPLKRVLILYPHQPITSDDYGFLSYFHAPQFGLYPKHTRVEEEAIAGFHSDAQYQILSNNRTHIYFPRRQSFITFTKVTQFFQECGTVFRFELCQFKVNLGLDDDDWRNLPLNMRPSEPTIRCIDNITMETANQALITVYETPVMSFS